MWSCSSPRKKTPRKNRRPAKQKTPRIFPILGGVLGVLFRYRSIWHKCAACIRRMQYTKGLGLSQQAFCNAKMAFVYTNALLATTMKPLNAISKFENYFLIRTVRFQVQLEADGCFSAQKIFVFASAASRASRYHLAIFEFDFTNPASKHLLDFAQTRYSAHKLCRLRILTDAE